MNEQERQKLIDKGNVLLDLTLFADFYSMEDGEIALLMRSIGSYIGTGEVPKFTKDQKLVKMAFNRFKVSYEANSRKYLDSCRRKSENKKKDWQKWKNKSDENQEIPY